MSNKKIKNDHPIFTQKKFKRKHLNKIINQDQDDIFQDDRSKNKLLDSIDEELNKKEEFTNEYLDEIKMSF